MKCFCCDNFLNRVENSLRNKFTGEYEQTCLKCLDGLGIEVIGGDLPDEGQIETDVVYTEDLYDDLEIEEQWEDS